jgi:hypothetical protein
LARDNSFPFVKQLAISLITIFLGSFVFAGVLENYKSDESIKIQLLEEYFKPARARANACLKKQNELFLHYPQIGGSLKVMFGELKNLIDHPELNKSKDYGIILTGLANHQQEVSGVSKKLPSEVENCRQDVFLDLEALSIATGTFNYFSEESSKRADKLNKIDQRLRVQLKENNSGFDADQLISLMRSFGEYNFSSEDDMRKMVGRFSTVLPMIEGYSIAMSEAEQEKYRVEAEFFSSIRTKAATQIDNRVKEGFFGWLF